MIFLTKSIITLLSRLLIFIFSIVVLVVTAQVLGMEGRGLFALIVLIATMTKMIIGLGIDVSNVYYAAKERFSADILISNSILFSIIFGSIGILGFLLIDNFSSLLDNFTIPFNLLLISIIAVPFLLLSGYISAILLGKDKILEYNIICFAQPGLLVIIFLAGLITTNFSLEFAIYAWSASVVIVGFSSLLLYKEFPILLIKYYVDAGKKIITFGLKSYLANLIQFFNLRFDYFLVTYFMSFKAVGIYSVSVAMAEILFHVPNAIGTVLFSRVSNYTDKEANRDTPIICRNVFTFTLVSAILFTFIAKFAFAILFTDKYNSSINPFLVLLPGTLALSIAKVLANDLAGRGKPIINMYVAICTFIMNIILNLILIPLYGLWGAALSSSITYSLSTLILVVIYIRLTNIPAINLFLIQKNDLIHYSAFIKKNIFKIHN